MAPGPGQLSVLIRAIARFRLWSSCVVGEIDSEIDQQIDLDEVRAVPLNPVIH